MSKNKNVSVMKQCFTVQQLNERDIKCVVVGDTSVGKTKLVHSYSCNLPEFDISELNTRKHVPSIMVLENCKNVVKSHLRFNINNIDATVAIWDTFGEHEKNREYSYCNADVVIICFSIGELESLNNVVSHWYPEVRSFCPKVPILIVGTQSDRRHHDPSKYMTPIKKKTLGQYLGLKSESGISGRINLVEPEIGRAVANSIKARQYIETSVVTKHGVNNVFANAVKFALERSTCSCISLSSSSKRLIQEPFCPIKKRSPEIKAIVGLDDAFFSSLFSPYEKYDLHDMTFIVDGHEIYAHTVILMLASCLFHEVVVYAYSVLYTDTPTKFSPGAELRECIASNGEVMYLPQGILDVKLDECTSHVEITLDYVNVQQFVTILEFFYTGEISSIEEADSLFRATCYLQLPLISRYLSNVLQDDIVECRCIQDELSRKFSQHGKGLIGSEFFSDFNFNIENVYSIPVHKVILTQRCEIMNSMFQNGHFIESQRSEVDFRDTNLESFLAVLEYLYTGDCREHIDDLHGTLQLANFLCLPRLITFCEVEIVNRLKDMHENENQEVFYTAIASFSLAQYHNAPQLAAWCLHFMATNYNDLCKQCGKEMKLLDEDTLKYLEENRWPPIWYLKEQDYYERSMKQIEKEQNEQKKKRKRNFRSCFFT